MSIRNACTFLAVAASLAAGSLFPANAAGIAGLARHSSRPAAAMPEGASALAPFAFIRYCVANPADCRPGDERRIGWTAQNRALVVGINRTVNRRIRPVNDRGDVWSADVSSGDCEDFALTKRRALVAAGLPASALRMTIARTAEGEGHAVLLIKTDRGDFVLDNRTNRLLAWQQTDLTFLKVASAEDPRMWKKTF